MRRYPVSMIPRLRESMSTALPGVERTWLQLSQAAPASRGAPRGARGWGPLAAARVHATLAHAAAAAPQCLPLGALSATLTTAARRGRRRWPPSRTMTCLPGDDPGRPRL